MSCIITKNKLLAPKAVISQLLEGHRRGRRINDAAHLEWRQGRVILGDDH